MKSIQEIEDEAKELGITPTEIVTGKQYNTIFLY